MQTLGDWVGLLGGIAGILVLLSGALVFMRGSYSKARIEALRADNSDLRSRVEDLEGDLERSKNKEKVLETRVTSLEHDNKLLADMITQRANVEAMTDLLTMHHQQAMTAWSDILDELRAR